MADYEEEVQDCESLTKLMNWKQFTTTQYTHKKFV